MELLSERIRSCVSIIIIIYMLIVTTIHSLRMVQPVRSFRLRFVTKYVCVYEQAMLSTTFNNMK